MRRTQQSVALDTIYCTYGSAWEQHPSCSSRTHVFWEPALRSALPSSPWAFCRRSRTAYFSLQESPPLSGVPCCCLYTEAAAAAA